MLGAEVGFAAIGRGGIFIGAIHLRRGAMIENEC